MKNYLTHLGSVIVLVGLLLISVGCGGEEKSETSVDDVNPEKSAKSRSKGGEQHGAELDPEAQRIDYWAPDDLAMVK